MEVDTYTYGITLGRELDSQHSSRLRFAATVNLDVTHDGTEEDLDGFYLAVNTHRFALKPGTNMVSGEFPISANYENIGQSVDFLIASEPSESVSEVWAHLEVTQLDLLMSDAGSVTTTPLQMTPIPVHGVSNGGSGGFHIEKSGALASVTSIAIIGYYNTVRANDLWPDGGVAPVAFNELRFKSSESAYVALAASIETPFDGTDWVSNTIESIPATDSFPDYVEADELNGMRSLVLCKVSLDGGTPAFALIENQRGY